MKQEHVKFVYKIRRKTDGVYSTGGMAPKWSSKGKTWSSIGHLKLHLRQFVDSYYKGVWPYDGCQIDTYEIVTVPSSDLQALNLLQQYKARKKNG